MRYSRATQRTYSSGFQLPFLAFLFLGITACGSGDSGSDNDVDDDDLTPINNAPVATNTNFIINENTILSDNVSATDQDNDLLSYRVTNSTDNGNLTFENDGSFTYQPNQNFIGQDNFVFVANDGSVDSNMATITITINEVNNQSATDEALRELITANNLTGDPTVNRSLPEISESLPQLGMKLFFSKSLGGDIDSACVTCHHPVLGGADNLSLPVGVASANEDLLGQGRELASGELPSVPRNAPTVFNTGLWDSGLFHDSRVESLGKESDANGAVSAIRTPDSAFGIADENAGANLASAQARFPVTSVEEMKGETFESGSDNQAIRAHLAARIGDYGEGANELVTNTWLSEFQLAFNSGDNAETLITFENIAHAIGEYERSMVFVNNPWKDYVEGDNNALTEQQKQGAILFLTSVENGGGGCINCHNGDFFTDEQHHTIGFPQIGPGKGDGNDDDFGRERETGSSDDRYRFRTPSLLNVAVTAPYGHSGAYQNLNEVMAHYNNPQGQINNFFTRNELCDLGQFESLNNCDVDDFYPNARDNTQLAINKLQEERNAGTSLFPATNLNQQERQELVAFLNALTDPCVVDRNCIGQWIPDINADGPDGNQLNAIDENGDFY